MLLRTLLFLLTTLPALAQNTPRWQPYVRAGLGLSRAICPETNSVVRFNIGNGDPTKPILGGKDWLSAGQVSIGFTRTLDGQFYIQAEAGVERKGSARHLTIIYSYCGVAGCSGTSYTGVGSSRATYLTVPVLVGYRFSKLNLAVGPYVSYKLGERQVYYLTTNNQPPPLIRPDMAISEYDAWDAGFAVNLTYPLASRFKLDMRYSQGMTSIAKQYEQFTEKSYHQSAQVGLNYFPFR